MKEQPQKTQQHRQQLLRQIEQLARRAIFGTASETYRTCGNPGCCCHGRGPKHGPHLYISYRGSAGKTTGYYVPKTVQEQARQGIEAWARLQEHLRELALLNKERIVQTARRKKLTSATSSS